MAFSAGHDMTDEFRFSDGLGKLYTAIAIIWSIVLVCGGVVLILNRELPFLRIRNVPLTISAVAILHVYWVLCLIAYGLNGFFPCATEFWIMNFYLPLGIALFHLSNTKLLHVAVSQRKYANMDSISYEKEIPAEHRHGWKVYARKLKSKNAYEKTKFGIALGMLVQLVCALVIFLISRKFHGSYGLVGQAVPETPLTKRECRKGWEWMLSIAWQFFWSWVYAPYLLWKVRGIRDTHGWRTQTIICCLSGLPASPMWLLSLYLPEMSKVSSYYIPPLWFAPSIFLIEAFMIFLPCWQIVRHRRLKKETLEIIAQWEKDKNGSSVGSEPFNIPQSPKRMSHKSSTLSMIGSRKAHPHMYTMAALEKALQTNPTPLLLFAALKDFSGENISFLNHVRDWKKNWLQQRSSALRFGPSTDESRLRYQQFVKAIEIYASFVCLRFSHFPINISHTHLKELATIFAESASKVNAEHIDSPNCVTPFADLELGSVDNGSGRGKDTMSMTSTFLETTSSTTEIEPKSKSKQATVIDVYKVKELNDKLPPSLSIPEAFGPGVFDNAAESVKYMVLTNTWPKFVDAGYVANVEKATAIERFQERLSGYGIGRSRLRSF